MQDQKKIGPNLKDVRLKLRKEWIPVWLENPQKFRPGTKMPTYWRIDGEGASPQEQERETNERKAIAAYLWQEGFEGEVPQQPQGDGAKGKQLFETRGCLACHSIGGDGDPKNQMGGHFAANLQRVGEKADYDYIVRWIHNPRQRWAPYSPALKRDLTREDYEKKGLPYVFDTEHSKSPIDGSELQVQNMTVMPNFRLSDSDTRDIATYLFSLGGQSSYPDASFMDDPRLKEPGRALIKQYGCAGCHEIKGFEDEQRIGKELTAEGATPIERLDFALLTHDAERGIDPHDPKKKIDPWYNRRGFFTNKLATPWIYDEGKEKEPKDMLRMPQPYLTDEWRNALTTFLLGSVGAEGANVPRSLFYNATNQQKDIQDGWWVVKKYNCMGCHTVQVGQTSVLSGLPMYQTPEGKVELPPGLTTEGARVDPNWLLNFLRDPSLSTQEGGDQQRQQSAAARSGTPSGASASGGTATGRSGAPQPGPPASTPGAQGRAAGTPTGAQPRASGANNGGGSLEPQPGANRNGVRTYLQARMPTFNFSPNELRILVRFFQAVSAQQEPYIKEQIEPLNDQEKQLARSLFTSQAAPCLKCHLTGDAGHDETASAPNFLQSGNRLKPGWTFRWLLDPQRIMPGTAMPSELFERNNERWVLRGMPPEVYNQYDGDHARLLVRYMLQLTPDEQRRIASGSPAATSGSGNQIAAAHRGLKTPATESKPKFVQRAAQQSAGRGKSGAQRANRIANKRGGALQGQTSSVMVKRDRVMRARARPA